MYRVIKRCMSARPQLHLTDAQLRVARLLASWERDEKAAFVPQLFPALGFSSASCLTDTLQRMERNGFIEILGGGAKGRPRLVRLTPKGRLSIGEGGLPLLGEIPAGPLAATLAEPIDVVEDSDLLPWQQGDFLLRVKGDSMTGDGILPGDLVLLRPEIDCVQGEIAAIQAGDDYEGTLKHVFVELNHVRLHASNPTCEDIIIPRKEWRGIAGVFRGLVRRANRS